MRHESGHDKPSAEVVCADALEALLGIPDNSFDACFCDPDYGLMVAPTIKTWKHDTPMHYIWSAVLRILKPGAPLLAFSGTRVYHRIVCAIEDGGFNIRDAICWLYGSGFPKSHDIGKAIDKKAGHSSAAKWWDGYGTGLKPAVELICLAMKPMEGTFAENVLKWGCGGLNIGGSKIGAEQRTNQPAGNASGGNSLNMSIQGMPTDAQARIAVGRWPTNTILDEQAARMLDEQGGASRFFYCAKASPGERMLSGERIMHPTMKPLKLCEYLARLILPPERGDPRRLVVPFCGVGSEMIGALNAGWDEVTGIDNDERWVDVARRRIDDR